MLRTRLFVGLLPLVLVALGMGLDAILVCHQLAGSFQRDLVAAYRASLACERMRAGAIRMSNAASDAGRAGPLAARRELDAGRSAFARELLAQSAAAAGTPRAPLVANIDAAYQALSELDGRVLSGAADRSLEAMQRDEDAYYRVVDAIEALERHDYATAEATAAGADSLARNTVRLLAGAMVAALLISLMLAWALAAALTRTQRTMEATLSSTPDPVFVFARGGAEAMRNPAAERLARSPDFAGGMPPAVAERLGQVLADGRHYLPTDYGKALTVHLGREDRHYLPRIIAIGDRLTEFKGAAVILQDVTKFRLLDDAKTNLVGTVSHELKTPLTSLRLAVYLLLEQKVGALTAGQLELLETARDEADRMLRIIEDILDLAKLESGAAALSRREVSVPRLLADMAREAQPHLAAAGQNLVVKAADDVGTVQVDTDRLRHVFLNLLTNAAKYARPGATVTLYAEPAPLGMVRFGVRDQGPGIPPEAVPHIFDRFYRVAGTPKKGAGLGLAIAREIVAAHGGSIGCASRPGEGSDFYFVVPGNSLQPAATMEV
ncbi:MAG TPA: HAMP domain-containing sensor histidine kinase [Opitutaceae bacterium]|nr:HAMP domain-containing sensor histidine kinase [Opitutaceae bacterium]